MIPCPEWFLWGFCIIYLQFDGIVYHFSQIFLGFFFHVIAWIYPPPMPVANEGLVREAQPKHKIHHPVLWVPGRGDSQTSPNDSKTNPEFL